VIDVGIVVGSTRPGRRALAVAQWVENVAQRRGGAHYVVIDVAEAGLPLYDEPRPAAQGRYVHEHTRRWSATIAPLDAYVLVTPEYNHGTSAALKNALDFLYAEWNDKAVGFVSYGSAGGARAVEQLRTVVAELRMADVRAQVMLSTATDFDGDVPRRDPTKEDALLTMLDQLLAWGGALAEVRAAREG
jgi:NAD(P)H-dependent FMN reductase